MYTLVILRLLGQLNFVEFLSCVIRLTLIAYGSLGMSPDAAVDEVAKDMHLGDINSVKQRLLRISRTNAGFGGWVDSDMDQEKAAVMALSMRRPKGLQEFMLPQDQMLVLQVCL
jgi:hypothetical protein